MPKSNIVFRESLEDDESDDEIVIIPYVKPPPMVIDLLESESDNGSDQGGSKKSSKKKSKKKKNKRDKERGQGQGGSIDVASLGDLTQESSVSSLLNVSACDPDDNIECDGEITSGQAVEPTTSAGVGCGSENVAAVTSNVSPTGFSGDTQLPSNPLVVVEAELGSGSQHFEKCLDAQSLHNMEVDNGERTETGMVMDGTPSAQNNDKTKRVRSERKSKGEGKSRVRTTSATQRTNEEIMNFLTTLGIQMEPNAFETPVTRKKQSRRRPCQVPAAAAEAEANSLDSSATNSNDGQNFPVPIKETTTAGAAFVSVTQDINSASKRDTPKGRRQRQAISGDLSDYTVSFTNKELNAINTSFQSNVLLAETGSMVVENTRDGFISVLSSESNKKSASPLKKMNPNYYSEVIDAVARGLEPSILSSSCLEPENVQHTIINEIHSEVMESLNKKNKNEATTKNYDSVDNHIEETLPAAISSNNSDTGNGMSSKNSPKSTSTFSVAKEVVSAVVGSPDSNVGLEKVSKSSVASTDTSTPTGAEKPVQTPEDEGNRRNKLNVDIITTRDVEGKRKFNDNEPPTTAALANKNTGEAGTRAKGNKENSDFKGRSPEKKRRRISNNNNIIPVSSKINDGIIREMTLETEARIVQEGSCGSVLTTIAPVHQMSTSNNATGHVPQDSYYPSTWSNHMRDFYGSIRNEDFEMDEIWPSLSDSEHLWRASKDTMPPPRNNRRHVRCGRCKQFGHLIKECTEKWKVPTCHYCGEAGHTSDNHSRRRTCPSALCLNCGRPSSRYAQKCHRCLLQSRPRCGICNVSGHDDVICPDIWRRYHSITYPDEYKKAKEMVKPNWNNAASDRRNLMRSPKLYKRPSTLYCANCGRRGHCYYDCNGSKFNAYHRHKPFVVCEAQANESTNTMQRPHSSGSSSASAPIPISYDSRTGRTVVMNAETMDQPELEVEIIQVQITNELALQNDESQTSNVLPTKDVATTAETLVTDPDKQSTLLESTFKGHLKTLEKAIYKYGCESKKCTNKLRQDEKCYQTFMEGQAHLKLLRAKQKGILQPLEQRNQVQISVINDGCKIHITGSSVYEASKDLHKLLWIHNMRKQIPGARGEPVIRVEENLNQKRINDGNTHDTFAVFNTSQLINVDDEDECVIIDSESLSSTKIPEKVVCAWISTQSNDKWSKKESFFMDQSASEHTEEISKDNETSESIQESASEVKNTTAKEQTGKVSWSEYVSPLTGLSFSLNSERSRMSNTGEENKSASAFGDSSSKNQLVVEGNTNIDEDMDVSVDDSPASPDMFDDVEEMDYATMVVHDTGDKQLSTITTEDEYSSDSDSDLIVLDPPPSVNENVEIITLDDEEELTPEPPKQTSGRREESVTLLQSEWELAITELAKKDNIISQISQEFSVDIMVSKEISSVLVRNGTDHARKKAKDEIVSWLESKCLGTDYHLVRQTVDRQTKQTSSPSKRKRKNKPKPVALRLHDVQVVQRNNSPGQQKSNKRGRKKSQWKKMIKTFNNSNSSVGSGSSSGSSNSHLMSPINHVPNFNKRNFKKSSPSSPFNHRGLLVHSPSPKKMQQHNNSSNNNNSVSFPIARGRGGGTSINRRKARYFDVDS